MSMPFIEMPQRAEALPSMTQQAAAAGGARRLRGVALHVHAARHHVLGDADAGIAVDHDGGVLVHAGAVIADMAVDLDVDRRVEPAAMAWRPRGLIDGPVRLVGVGAAGRCRRSHCSSLQRRGARDRLSGINAALPEIDRGGLRLPDRAFSMPGSRRARDIPSRRRHSRRSRPSPPACRRSDRAARRSRSRCRPRRCRSRRGRRG